MPFVSIQFLCHVHQDGYLPGAEGATRKIVCLVPDWMMSV